MSRLVRTFSCLPAQAAMLLSTAPLRPCLSAVVHKASHSAVNLRRMAEALSPPDHCMGTAQVFRAQQLRPPCSRIGRGLCLNRLHCQ